MHVSQIVFLLLSSFQVLVFNPDLVNKDVSGLPPSTLHNVLEFKTYSGAFFTRSYCLNIQATKDSEPGELFIIEKKTTCEETLIEKEKLFSKKYYNLKISFDFKKVLIKIDQEKIEVPLINFKQRENKKFSHHIKVNSHGSFEISTGLGGEKTQWLKDGDICYETDDDCQLVMDNCDMCPYGTYYIKNNQCKNNLTKVCGIDNCGERGQYACIRGPIASNIKEYCMPDSPFGFCKPGLRVVCINGVLTCE